MRDRIVDGLEEKTIKYTLVKENIDYHEGGTRNGKWMLNMQHSCKKLST